MAREETLWKIVSGSPDPEELAALTAVLTALHRRAAHPADPAPAILFAHWAHTPAPPTAGSWHITTAA